MLEVYSIPEIKAIITAHLDEAPGISPSPFASFTTRWQSADVFAKGVEGSTLLVLDTTLCQDLEIFHTSDLCEAGLVDIWYPDEYLIFGPIPGAAFRTIDAIKFRSIGYQMIADGHTAWDHHGNNMDSIYTKTHLQQADVAVAKALAKAAWPDSGTRALEVVITLTANFVGIRLYHLEEKITVIAYAWVTAMIVNELHHELNELIMQVANQGHKLQLVNRASEPEELSSGVIIMKKLLIDLEDAVHTMAQNQNWQHAHYWPDIKTNVLPPEHGVFAGFMTTFYPFNLSCAEYYEHDACDESTTYLYPDETSQQVNEHYDEYDPHTQKYLVYPFHDGISTDSLKFTHESNQSGLPADLWQPQFLRDTRLPSRHPATLHIAHLAISESDTLVE